jgi:hypothetical protein
VIKRPELNYDGYKSYDVLSFKRPSTYLQLTA